MIFANVDGCKRALNYKEMEKLPNKVGNNNHTITLSFK